MSNNEDEKESKGDNSKNKCVCIFLLAIIIVFYCGMFFKTKIIEKLGLYYLLILISGFNLSLFIVSWFYLRLIEAKKVRNKDSENRIEEKEFDKYANIIVEIEVIKKE